MVANSWIVEETGVPSENHCLASSHWQLFHMPRPGSEPSQTTRPSEQALLTTDTAVIIRRFGRELIFQLTVDGTL